MAGFTWATSRWRAEEGEARAEPVKTATKQAKPTSTATVYEQWTSQEEARLLAASQVIHPSLRKY